MMNSAKKIAGRLTRGESGISSVEMAIILPLFLLFVFGTFQLGLAYYYKQTITNAAREGARLGIVIRVPPVDEAQITSRIETYLTNSGFIIGEDTDINVDFTSPAGNQVAAAACTTGCRVSVDVTVPISEIVPGIIPGFPSTLTGNAVMRHE
ncbi:MAG TPA: TadE family protein [Nitrospiria bacterium]